MITITQGGPDIADGVYTVVLTKLEGPKTVTAQNGPKAGQEIQLFDWTFVVDDGQPHAGTEIQGSTSTASGPKSKMYAWLTALLGGKPPAVGQSFDAGDLVGRFALATIRKDDSGWPRIENLGALPVQMLGAKVAQASGLPPAMPTAQSAPAAPAPQAAPAAPAGQFTGSVPTPPMSAPATEAEIPF